MEEDGEEERVFVWGPIMGGGPVEMLVMAARDTAFRAIARTGEKLAADSITRGGGHRLCRRQRTQQDLRSLRADDSCSCLRLP